MQLLPFGDVCLNGEANLIMCKLFNGKLKSSYSVDATHKEKCSFKLMRTTIQTICELEIFQIKLNFICFK